MGNIEEKKKVGRPKGTKNKLGVKVGRPKGSKKPIEEKREKYFKFRVSNNEIIEIEKLKELEDFKGLKNRDLFFKLKQFYEDSKK